MGVLAVAVLAAPATAARPLRFLPQWLPQAQFAGYYVAHERGFYRQAGLEVTLLTGGPQRPASTALESGDADVATLWLSTGIQMRARGVAIAHVAQISQRSALMLVAKKSSGIRTPGDLAGKKVGVWDGDFLVQPQAFFDRYRLAVEVVPVGSTINLFLQDGVQVTSAMWYNEYHTILNSGLDPEELVTFFFHEHGLNFPEDGLYCRAEIVRDDPGRCAAFAAASLDGWRWAFAHPEDALDIVIRHMTAARVASNRPHQRWMLARMRDVIAADASVSPGDLRQEDYDLVARVLRQQGWITATPDFRDFHPAGATPP